MWLVPNYSLMLDGRGSRILTSKFPAWKGPDSTHRQNDFTFGELTIPRVGTSPSWPVTATNNRWEKPMSWPGLSKPLHLTQFALASSSSPPALYLPRLPLETLRQFLQPHHRACNQLTYQHNDHYRPIYISHILNIIIRSLLKVEG